MYKNPWPKRHTIFGSWHVAVTHTIILHVSIIEPPYLPCDGISFASEHNVVFFFSSFPFCRKPVKSAVCALVFALSILVFGGYNSDMGMEWNGNYIYVRYSYIMYILGCLYRLYLARLWQGIIGMGEPRTLSPKSH